MACPLLSSTIAVKSVDPMEDVCICWLLNNNCMEAGVTVWVVAVTGAVPPSPQPVSSATAVPNKNAAENL